MATRPPRASALLETMVLDILTVQVLFQTLFSSVSSEFSLELPPVLLSSGSFYIITFKMWFFYSHRREDYSWSRHHIDLWGIKKKEGGRENVYATESVADSVSHIIRPIFFPETTFSRHLLQILWLWLHQMVIPTYTEAKKTKYSEKITTFPPPQKVVLTERQNWGIDIGWSTNRVYHTINSFDPQNHALRWALIAPFTEEQMKG